MCLFFNQKLTFSIVTNILKLLLFIYIYIKDKREKKEIKKNKMIIKYKAKKIKLTR